MTRGFPFCTTAAQELVVPRSMPMIGPVRAAATGAGTSGGMGAEACGGAPAALALGAATALGEAVAGAEMAAAAGPCAVAAVAAGAAVGLTGTSRETAGAGFAALSLLSGGGGLPPRARMRSRPASADARRWVG